MSETSPSLTALMGTLVTDRGSETVASYTDHLGQQVGHRGVLSHELAAVWGAPALAGCRYWVLENRVGKPWLRIIEDPECPPPQPLRHTGWLALEVCVTDVDTLGQKLRVAPFSIIGPPANLDVSDNIRAMQVAGLAGEVLYLTEINGEAPPFRLPRARCPVDSLFIPVLCCHERHRALAEYEAIADNRGLCFETKITVVNRAYGYPVDKRHPVATLQLAGDTLIEIDQLAAATPALPRPGHLPAGIAMVSFSVRNLDDVPGLADTPSVQFDPPYGGARTVCLRGAAGEVIELIESATWQDTA
ncbi:hypothetical protein FKG94_09115 [Exilibacterium tricleocarpae]|uniref:Uncharacterized protein n=1 Tax=Exilibacterium tricleocarpae TaxID=2591008 RepID=A0A545TVS2_9GAMM|nr:hypothetical protein [Exilibacterium tricleocarpae]TQV81251.1 hypothetical protein FKG94_09115 [Exilibacterium tricleocarpae]